MSNFGCAIRISAGGGRLTAQAKQRLIEFFDKLREGENFYDAAGDPFVYALTVGADDTDVLVTLSAYHVPDALDDEMRALTLSEDEACAEAIVKMLSDRFGKPLVFEVHTRGK